jgi:hypothetical protein
MAVVVEHSELGLRFVVIGAGYGMYRSAMPGVLGAMTPIEDEGEKGYVAVCDSKGRIRWFGSKDLRVVSVDGKSPAELLNA